MRLPDSVRPAAAGLLRAIARSLDGTAERLQDVARAARFTRGRLTFVPRATDVWVATYPRSGTTWMVYLLHRLRGGDAAFEHIDDVSPWFERGLAIGTWTAEALDALASPRIFKTHLLPRWVPEPARVVYVERDGLDVAASYHALYRDYLGFSAGFDAFFERFVAGDVQYGAWATHRERWRASGRVDAWVRYEALRDDPASELSRVADAIGLPTDATAVANACASASLPRMRAQQEKFDHATALLRERGVARGSFIRDGRGGGTELRAEHRARLSEAMGRELPDAPLAAFLR